MAWMDEEGNIRTQDGQIIITAKKYIEINNAIDITNYNNNEKLKRKVGQEYLFSCL